MASEAKQPLTVIRRVLPAVQAVSDACYEVTLPYGGRYRKPRSSTKLSSHRNSLIPRVSHRRVVTTPSISALDHPATGPFAQAGARFARNSAVAPTVLPLEVLNPNNSKG